MPGVDLVFCGALRDRRGGAGERIAPPSHILTVADLIGWMAAREEPYATAFADPARIRAAIDRQHAGPKDSFFGAQEVALFPPVSGT